MRRAAPIGLLIVALGTGAMAAEREDFAVDYYGWHRGQPEPTREQKRIAEAYLDAVRRRSGGRLDKLGDLRCQGLPQDLVPEVRFYHCRVGFAANAVDGGPFDAGRALAWDGSRGYLHEPDPGDGAVTGLAFRSVELLDAALPSGAPKDDPRGAALTARLGAALAARAARPSGPGTLPDWLRFALCVHFDVDHVAWQPGLESRESLARELIVDAPAHAEAAALARAAGPAGLAGTVRYTQLFQTRAALVWLEAPARGFRLHDKLVASEARHGIP